MHTTQETLILAALYHESSRASVAAGDTLAHAVGQDRPFTEFGYISSNAREGQRLTALNLQQRVSFVDFQDAADFDPAAHLEEVERLARVIHDAEREAIERGLAVVTLTPPRPWVPFDELPQPARRGRRQQAAFFLGRFTVKFLVE